jgi:tetratricopeptide (TPR) repeat protein
MNDSSKVVPALFRPDDPAYRRKLWVLGKSEGRRQIYVFWKRLICVLAVLTVIGWFSAAGAAWTYVRYKHGLENVSYWNIAAPWRWQKHRKEVGQFYLAQAPKKLAQQDYVHALACLRIGVTRVPEDLHGRQLLAQVYAAFGRPDLAVKTMEAGLPWGSDDLDYLKLLFSLLFQVQQDKQALEIAHRILPQKPDNKIHHLYAALQAATARYYRGEYDQAEHIVKQWNLERSVEGCILLAKMDWDRGYPDATLSRLEQALNRHGWTEPLLIQLIQYHRKQGHYDKAREYAQFRRVNAPTGPGPSIDLIYSYFQENNQEAIARETNVYLTTYAQDHLALMMMAWMCMDTGDVTLAQKVQTVAAANGHPLNGFTFAVVQAQLTNQDYSSALASVDEALKSQKIEGKATFDSMLAGLQAVALFATSKEQDGALQLKSFLSQSTLRAADAVLLARQLQSVNAIPAARTVLTHATATDYLNQMAWTDLVRLDAHTNNRAGLIENLPKLIVMRKPSRAALEEALMVLDPVSDSILVQQTRLALALTTRELN